MIGDIFCLFFFLFQWHDSFYTCRETRQDKNGSSRLLVLMLLFCSMKRGIRLVSTKWTEKIKRLFFSFFFLFFNIFGALCGWGCSDHALAHTQRGEIRQTKNPNIRLRNETRMCVFFFILSPKIYVLFFYFFFYFYSFRATIARNKTNTQTHNVGILLFRKRTSVVWFAKTKQKSSLEFQLRQKQNAPMSWVDRVNKTHTRKTKICPTRTLKKMIIIIAVVCVYIYSLLLLV